MTSYYKSIVNYVPENSRFLNHPIALGATCISYLPFAHFLKLIKAWFSTGKTTY